MSDETKSGQILSFTDHLQELRVRIIICIVFFAITFLGSFIFAPQVVTFLMKPLTSLSRDDEHAILTIFLNRDGTIGKWQIASPNNPLTTATTTAPPTASTFDILANNSFRIMVDGMKEPINIGPKTQSRLSYLTPLEPFYLWLQGALLLSAILTIPMVVYQFWLFISPGLLKAERGTVGPLLLASIVLFPLGAGFAYAIMHVTLKVLMSFGDQIPGLEPNLVASSYLSFILIMMMMFGLVFEFPLVLLLMAGLGIVTSEMLVQKRRIAIVALSIVSAVATPSPDPATMIIMLLPLLALYEGSIYAIKYMERKRDRNMPAVV